MLREQILSVLTTHTHTHKKELCEVMDVLISLIVIKCKKKKYFRKTKKFDRNFWTIN